MKPIAPHRSHPPLHPGRLLAEEVLPATGKTITEIAALLGISRAILHSILREKTAVTPAMAMRLGKLVGNGPGLWINLQRNHDLWHAQRDVDVSKIKPLRLTGEMQSADPETQAAKKRVYPAYVPKPGKRQRKRREKEAMPGAKHKAA